MRDALGDERGAVLVGSDDVAQLRGGKRALQRPQRGIVAAAARADDVRDAFGLEVADDQFSAVDVHDGFLGVEPADSGPALHETKTPAGLAPAGVLGDACSVPYGASLMATTQMRARTACLSWFM